MSSRLSGFLSIILIATTVALSVLTLTGWIDSHAALQSFDASFDQLIQGDDPHQFAVFLKFINEGEIDTQLESAAVSLYYDDRLIAATNWFPEDFYISPAGTATTEINLVSNLDTEQLAALDPASDGWHVRLRLRLTHPVRTDAIILQRTRSLTR